MQTFKQQVKVCVTQQAQIVTVCGPTGCGGPYRHVRPAAGVSGFGDGVDQLAADAKVAQLDVALPVQQDV